MLKMAPTQGAVAKPKPKKVKKATKKQQKAKQKMPTQPAKVAKMEKKVERRVRRLEKKVDGPKVDDQMTTTVTLGIIQGQQDAGLNRQMRIPFNPLLMKSTEGATSTPLSIRGSMYELWKVSHAELHATPLSGFSNVVGSVGFMALTLNGLEAGADSIDTVKARKHVQMALGRPAHLRLTARDLSGPRNGWWLVDTSEDPAESYGPAVDMLLAYSTQNLLNTSGSISYYTGTLWQIELRVTYQFSTYHPKPGLQTLISETLTTGKTVSVTTDTDGSLVMTTEDLDLLRIFNMAERHYPRGNAQTSGVSQTIWAVAGAAVEGAATVLGPWGWLLKGGFWLVRKIFGAEVNATTKFRIYPSITAAAADQPIYGGTGSQNVTLPIVHVSEVVNPNPESNVAANPTLSSSTAVVSGPYRPVSQPTPVYGTSNNQGYAKTFAGIFLTGNFSFVTAWYASAQAVGAGTASGEKDSWQYLIGATFDDGICCFQGTNDQTNFIGEPGAVGTGTTWARSYSNVWSSLNDWKATNNSWTRELSAVQLPEEFKKHFGLAGSVLVVKGQCWAQSFSTEGTQQFSTRAWIFISQNGGSGFVTSTTTQPSSSPTNFNFLRAPICITLNYTSSSAGTTGINITKKLIQEIDDDNISLADSFLVHEDEPDALELEREFLLTRLRDLDLRRFESGSG